VLTVHALEAGYGRAPVLRDANLRVTRGELITLVGPNGAGKTTLLRVLSGLLVPRSGSVRFDGDDIAGHAPEDIVRRGLVTVPEGRELFGPLSVADNLALGAYALGRAHRRRRSAGDLDRVLALFPALGPRLRQPVATLSGGEQQMVAIGRALMGRPRLLLLDEPSVGLAPLVVRDIFRVLATLKREGLTMLLVEQNARAAFRVADRCYVLRPGGHMAEVAANGAAAESARAAYGLSLLSEESRR
jgi:branched-chain amino acid transport system ATP-binding protein